MKRTLPLCLLACAAPLLFGQGMASRGVKPQPRAAFSGKPWNSTLTNIARSAGLTSPTVFGGEDHVLYAAETSSGGVAFVDYDNDGFADIFVTCGTRLNENPPEATNRLYHNNHDGTFSDVTDKAGLRRTGWAQGVAVADYDNDGFLDLFVTYWGENALYHNNGNGTFTDVAARSGLLPAVKPPYPTWYAGSSFVDYDRDGFVDLFVSVYIDFDMARTPKPGENPNCNWKGVAVPCGPRGLKTARHYLYHNRGDGTFEDVSAKAGIAKYSASFGMTVLSTDLDGDGWPDIYVACDSTPSLFFHNNHDGTFSEEGIERGIALNDDGQEQAGMGLFAGDYNGDGILDIFKTHFADDVQMLYQGEGQGQYRDVSTRAGLSVETRYICWGVGLEDFDNDGWPDLLLVTGNVYPGIEGDLPNYPYRTPPMLFRNLGTGRFEQLLEQAGPAIAEPHAARGSAFADFDNDGDIDVVVWNRNELPSLFRNDVKPGNHWLQLKLQATVSNRAAIGAQVTLSFSGRKLSKAVLSQSSFYSSSDQRLHFGLGAATAAEADILWPSGQRTHHSLKQVDRLVTIEEPRPAPPAPAPAPAPAK